MNLTEALKILSDHGYKTFTNRQLKGASEYFEAFGFIKGTLEGLKLYVPKEVMERLERGSTNESKCGKFEIDLRQL